MALALEDMVGSPTCENGSYYCGKLKYGNGPGGTVDVHTPVLGKELGTPVKHSHTEHIDEDICNGEHPYPLVAEYHMCEKCLVGTLLAAGFFLSGVGSFELRETYALRGVLEGEKADGGTTYGYNARDDEAPAPCAHVGGIAHDLRTLVGSAHSVPALDGGSQVGCNAGNHRAVSAHVGSHIGHDETANHHSAECSYGVGGVPYAHLCGELTRSNPLREHAGARRIAEALEILVEHYGNTHDQNEHVDKLRTLVHTGNQVAEVNSEAESEIGKGAEEQTYSHKDLGADLLHDEAVDKTAEAVNQRAYCYDDTETGVGNAILSRKTRHGNGKILADEIVDGIDNHRHHDGMPLPRFEILSVLTHYISF